ncbi:MAG: GT4 family glycosyltransferase PelF [Planctomycetes bacterium]|nr:GT4 family glycosyltransferase PelF [Planctomycetota bacterium]
MKADVCFVLEGTYPFVAGGVSTWVDQTIKANPHLRFAILHLAANEESSQVFKYEIPSNVISLTTAYLHETKLKSYGAAYKDNKVWQAIETFYTSLPDVDYGKFTDMIQGLVGKDGRVNSKSLLFSRQSWDILKKMYHDNNISFIDFFWTWRFTHLPLLSLLNVDIPSASIYHSASTGYAGLLGCMAKIKKGGNLLITEHGLYAKERKIEISQSNWVYDERSEDYRASEDMGFFRQWWISMFMIMSRLAYEGADLVTTLYKGNYDMQVDHGCPDDKLVIIPNGIDVDGYKDVLAAREKVRAEKTEESRFTIGFVGRVTPIKDVKTFVRAIKIVVDKYPKLHVLVMGPMEEDPEYVDECKILIDMFDLNDNIEFTGRVNVREYYPKLDVVVLTSVSEGLPFVILEAHAAGIPCISSDVGACKELLTGLTQEDQALGPSGVITYVASPGETAEAILRMIQDEAYYNKLCVASLSRVDMFYRLEDINARYTHIYHDLMRR